jgi:hypothetical protein
MLWNAIRPIDERTYFDIDKLEVEILERMLSDKTDTELSAERRAEIVKEIAERTALWNEDPNKAIESVVERIQHDVATKNDWYNWNIRNWGTKWDITEQAWLISETEDTLRYSFMTAWSPPIEAITNLARQFPTLEFTMRSSDEAMDWAVEANWQGGDFLGEEDLPFTHDLAIELGDYCWACDGENKDDPDYAEERAERGCPID